MRVLYIEPLRRPRLINIPHTLDAMQALVRGCIGISYPFDDPIGVVVNDNGIAEGLMLNRVVNNDIIHGPFFICGLDTDDLTDLPEELVSKYTDLFMSPEVFIPGPDNTLAVIKICTSPEEE